MDKPFILAIDQSTSGTKALIVNRAGQIIARRSMAHEQIYPQAGWLEHDPVEIYTNVKTVIRQVMQDAGVLPSQLALLAITNQRETALIWDKTTGQPIYNAIVWQCRRTADMCEDYKARGYEQMVKDRTGLLLDPYFSATKWRWILDHVPGARDRMARGDLLAGTIDSWLVWKLTGGQVHATDYTNASRTSVFNIQTLTWDEELVDLFTLSPGMLPEVKSSTDLFGYTADPDLFAEQVPISGVIGDSQGALFGQLCFKPGMAKATYGTGTSVLMNVGPKPVVSRNGLVTAIAWGYKGEVHYALEGIIHTSADSLKWARENLGLFQSFEEAEQLATELPDNDGVYLVPAFVGLGAPYWDAHARAAFIGMSRRTNRAHLIRAALESIAYQVRDVFELIKSESGVDLQVLRADGGAAGNRFLMQFQADMLQTEVMTSAVPELSAMGSVYLGGLGMGVWSDPDEIARLMPTSNRYVPHMAPDLADRYYQGWQKAVERVLTSRS